MAEIQVSGGFAGVVGGMFGGDPRWVVLLSCRSSGWHSVCKAWEVACAGRRSG